jgi:perosamine synthetase
VIEYLRVFYHAGFFFARDGARKIMSRRMLGSREDGGKMRYPVAAPTFQGNELQYVTECVQSTWISSVGKFLVRFEEQVAQYLHARYAVATCNGTVALHLALVALDLRPGDEVILPALTYVATVNSVVYCGGEPVFADCTPDTWCICPESVERLITPRTKGILVVHLFGHPCNMGAIQDLATRHGLWVLEDSAESLGATWNGQPVGALGAAGTLSFFGNKTITTGEGGMVVTNDPLLAQRMRLLRGQGMDPERRYWHTVVGFNYRMTNLSAAIGVAQMERVAELVGDRRRIASWYHARFRDVPEIVRPVELPGCQNSYWMYSILVPEAERRATITETLASGGIETRPMFYPCMDFPMYRSQRSDRGCPMTRQISYRGICLPSSSYLSEGDVDEIARQVIAAVKVHKFALAG